MTDGRLSRIISTAKRVVLFDATVYPEIMSNPSAIEDGLILICLVGLLVGASAGIGIYLEYATMPRFEDIAKLVMKGPWFPPEIPKEIKESIDKQIEAGFEIAKMFITPTPLRAIADFIGQPLSMLFSWLVWGVLVHFSAKLFKGKGSFRNMLATTSFTAAPQVVRIASMIPGVGIVGSLGLLWGVICYVFSVKYTHNLSTAGAALASLLPLAAAFLLISLVVLVIISAVAKSAMPLLLWLVMAAIVGASIYIVRRSA